MSKSSGSIVDVLDRVIGIPTANNNGDLPSFLPSKTFQGSKAGYVFRTSDLGTGYHLDDLSQPEQKRARLVRFDASRDTTQSIPPRPSKLSGEELLAQAEKAAASSHSKQIHLLSSASIKAAAASLEKTHSKNQLLRAQHPDEPEKFMINELALNDEIVAFKDVAVDPSSYQSLVEAGAMRAFLGLLTHDNSDVAMSVINVLVELLDPALLNEDDSKTYERETRAFNVGILGDAFVNGGGLDSLSANLGRFDETVEEDAKGVEESLTLVESLLDLDRAGVLNQSNTDGKESISTVTSICKTPFLSWLFQRIEKNDTSDDSAASAPISPAVIRLHASEVLATILQHEDYSSNKCGPRLARCPQYISIFDEEKEKPHAKSNGDKVVDGMEILLLSIAAYRKSDPQIEVECEFLENVFDALAASLLRSDNVQDFVEKEGIELMLRCVREKVHSGGGALKVLNFALSGSATSESASETNNQSQDVYKRACETFIHAGGIKLLFPLYMGRKSVIPCPAACSEGGSELAKKALGNSNNNKAAPSKRAKRAAHARKKWLAEVEENVINVLYSLTRHLDGDARYDAYSRLLAKFVEEDCVSIGVWYRCHHSYPLGSAKQLTHLAIF